MMRSTLQIVAFLLLYSGAPTSHGSPSIRWALGTNPDLIAEAIILGERERTHGSSEIVQLLHRSRIRLKGTRVSKRVEDVFFYRTPDSVQHFGNDRIVWDSSREDIRFTEVLVIRADGSRHTFDADTVSVLDTDSFDVFTDWRNIVLQLPGLQAGAISILSYERTVDDGLPYFFDEPIKTGIPRRQLEFIVEWDTQAPRWHTDSASLQCQESRQKLLCQATEIPPANLDSQVLYADVLPHFLVSPNITWQDVITEFRDKVESAKSSSQRLPDVVSELAQSGLKIAQIQDFASRQIRYVSFSRGEHSRLPHKLDITLKNRYGDCKDKSTLLLALLEEAGVTAYPALVATDRERPQKLVLPNNGYFDHMVVCMQTDSGERCIDPTDPYADSRTTPGSIQGKVRLNLRDGSTPSRIPQSDFRWQFAIENELTFHADGSQQESLTRRYFSEYGARMRQALKRYDTPGREQWLREQYVPAITEGVELAPFELRGLDNVDEPVVVLSRVRFPPMVDTNERLDYTDYAVWLRRFVANQRVEKGHYGYHFPGMRINSEYRFDLNSLWEDIEVGPSVDFRSPYGTMGRSYQVKDGVITVRTAVEVGNQEIRLGEVKPFNRFLDLIVAESRIRFWGNPTPHY